MTEPLRTAPASDGSADADRDALIERLLLAGLDHYFRRPIRTSRQRLDPGGVSRTRPRACARLYRAGPRCACRAAAGDRTNRFTAAWRHTAPAICKRARVADARGCGRRQRDGAGLSAEARYRRGRTCCGRDGPARGRVPATAGPPLRRHTDKLPAPRSTNWIGDDRCLRRDRRLDSFWPRSRSRRGLENSRSPLPWSLRG